MATRWSAAARGSAIEAVGTMANGGSVQFRTGTPPASVEDSPTGTLLVTVDLQSPAFGSASDGEITANGLPLESVGDENGEIGYARIVDSSGDPVYDEDDVSTSSESKITVNTLTVSQGVDFELVAMTLRARNPSS